MSIQSIGADSTVSQQIIRDAADIDMLIEVAKKQDSKNTTHEILDLLIEYIISKTGDSSKNAGEDIAKQISEVLQNYRDEVGKANTLHSQVDAIANDPKQQTESNLQKLEKILASLQNDPYDIPSFQGA